MNIFQLFPKQCYSIVLQLLTSVEVEIHCTGNVQNGILVWVVFGGIFLVDFVCSLGSR